MYGLMLLWKSIPVEHSLTQLKYYKPVEAYTVFARTLSNIGLGESSRRSCSMSAQRECYMSFENFPQAQRSTRADTLTILRSVENLYARYTLHNTIIIAKYSFLRSWLRHLAQFMKDTCHGGSLFWTALGTPHNEMVHISRYLIHLLQSIKIPLRIRHLSSDHLT